MSDETTVDGLVSVIIPVYNVGKYIGAAMDSALSQTYANIELILVDDCATDISAEIIAEYQKKHSNVFYYKQPRNMGAAAARNKAIQLARGRFIAFLDGDDIWRPEKIKTQLAIMKREKAGLCCTGSVVVDVTGTIENKIRRIPEKITYQLLLKNTVITTSSVVLDRQFIHHIQMPNQKTGEDYACWLGILHTGVKAVGINEPLLRYRVIDNSLSANKLTVFREIWYAQHIQEKIPWYQVMMNFVFFSWNAFKKHFL